MLLALVAYSLTSAADPPADPSSEIIVETPRGRASGGIHPLLEISPAELDSYGVDTLSDLVDALRPLTRSSRSDQMAVVLINGHLAGQTEFDNLPREAVERVDVLPESVALQYGFSENQRVLNFILREHYRAVPTRATDSGATEGGDHALSTDASLVRLDDEARVTVLANYSDTAWLRDSDRNIESPDSYYRTLQPDKTDAKIAATLSHAIVGVSSSLEASFETTSAKSLQGYVASGAGDAAGAYSGALEQASPTRTSRVAGQLTGQIHNFVWGATAYYSHMETKSSSDTGVDDSGKLLVDRTAASFNVGNLQLSLSGPLASLPAGLLIANFKFAYQYQGFDTRNAYPGSALQTGNLVRSVRSGNFNASIPIASRDRGVLPVLGELSGTLNATLDNVSDFGTLVSMSVGVDWTPVHKLHLSGIYTEHRIAPTVQQLKAPPVFTPNVEVFDYIAGETAYVTQITGGDGDLRSANNKVASSGISLGPFLGKTVFSAHYEKSWILDAIGSLPPTTPQVELAFPDRFVRDAGGNLVEIDNRSVNLTREVIEDIKWGFNVWVPLGASAPRVTPNRIEFSLFDTWYLHDVALIRAGVPVLDFLNGAPSDVAGGQPRHKVELRALVYDGGVGTVVNAAWRDSTEVGSGDTATPNLIAFCALATVDLRLFADFERVALTKNRRWSKGARLSLAVTNLFDRRQTVHDTTGVTPAAFAPGFLDPPGRTLALTVRKVF